MRPCREHTGKRSGLNTNCKLVFSVIIEAIKGKIECPEKMVSFLDPANTSADDIRQLISLAYPDRHCPTPSATNIGLRFQKNLCRNTRFHLSADWSGEFGAFPVLV
jgi:hypothetical protein